MVTAVKKKVAPRPQAKAAPQTGAKRVRSAAPAPQKSAAPKALPPSVAATETGTAKTHKKKSKPEKIKVVRDSFTIPKLEYAQIATLKKRALSLGLDTKKSELIRAGLSLLSSSSDAALRKALANVPTLKTGRPGKA